jgi:ribonuclease HI
LLNEAGGLCTEVQLRNKFPALTGFAEKSYEQLLEWYEEMYQPPIVCLIEGVSQDVVRRAREVVNQHKARESETLDVWIDGSLIDGKAAYAVYIPDQPTACESGRVIGPQTSPRAENSAFAAAVEICKCVRAPVFKTDCLSLVRAVNKIHSYGTLQIKGMANSDLIAFAVDRADEYFGKNWRLEHVPAHRGIDGNEAADKRAKAATRQPLYRSRFAFADLMPWNPEYRLFINGMPAIGTSLDDIDRMQQEALIEGYNRNHHLVHFAMRNSEIANTWINDKYLPVKLLRFVRLVKDGNLRTRAYTATFKNADNDESCVICGHDTDDLAHSLNECTNLRLEYI